MGDQSRQTMANEAETIIYFILLQKSKYLQSPYKQNVPKRKSKK